MYLEVVAQLNQATLALWVLALLPGLPALGLAVLLVALGLAVLLEALGLAVLLVALGLAGAAFL